MNRSNLNIVLISMFIGLIILLCVCFATIYLQPNVPFNPLSPARATSIAEANLASATPTPTITLTPLPTFPPTWTPSATVTPAPTKTPTNTRTVTPTRTDTPTPTNTPTRTPTRIVPPTFTPIPPYDFVGRSGDTQGNCANIKLSYSVVGPEFEPISGFRIEYGEIGVPGSVFQTVETQFSDIYGVTLIPGTNRAASERSHNWFAYLIKDGEKLSKAVLFTTDPMYALPEESCSSEDADESCVPDPCTSDDAANVKHIDFQPQITGVTGITGFRRANLCEPPYEDFVIERTCNDCRTQADAQRLFIAVGGPRVDIYDFDRDGDGVACETLPLDENDTVPACEDFDTQAQAQFVLDALGGPNRNTDRIDPDRNGIACEDLP